MKADPACFWQTCGHYLSAWEQAITAVRLDLDHLKFIVLNLFIGLVLFRLYKYRSDFESVLNASGSRLSKSRFLRLFFLAFITFLTILPAEAYIVYYDVVVSLPWHPYSWSRIHGPQWYHIQKFPTQGQVFFDRYLPLSMGLVIFTFFGFGRDAMSMYRAALWYLGLGRCFPSVARPVDTQATTTRPANASSAATLVESTTTRAKRLFSQAKKRTSRCVGSICIYLPGMPGILTLAIAVGSVLPRTTTLKRAYRLPLRSRMTLLTSVERPGISCLGPVSIVARPVVGMMAFL